MFTSRAEDRLTLRQDTADQRLTGIGRAAGLVDDERWRHFEAKKQAFQQARDLAEATRIGHKTAAAWLRQPEFHAAALPQELLATADAEIWEIVETDFKYEGYVRRQALQNRQISTRQAQVIPLGFDFTTIPGLRPETRQKLLAVRPGSLGHASRISGVTPADLAIISIWLTKNAASAHRAQAEQTA
jgi:tRNA uridine 5-carboxymethylaminomethyl modification enzyme